MALEQLRTEMQNSQPTSCLSTLPSQSLRCRLAALHLRGNLTMLLSCKQQGNYLMMQAHIVLHTIKEY
jgi:hypothetical protein